MKDWEQIRKNYPLIQKGGYFNTASFGALSLHTIEAQKKHLDDMLLYGNGKYDEWMASYYGLKVELANYLNTKEQNVTFFPDVSNGINKICDLLPIDKEVVLIREDFPSVTLPWITHQFKVKWIEYEDFINDYLGVLEKELADGNKILCLSWVFYNHGFMIDPIKVGALCKKYNSYFILDATQGLGAFELDMDKAHIDFMVASCFKWFMAGDGVTIGAVSDTILNQYQAHQSGWNMLKDTEGSMEDKSNYKSDASRFEIGHVKFQNIKMLSDSFYEMKSMEFEAITGRTKLLIKSLRNKFDENGIEVLTPAGEAPSSIISIRSNETILKKLKEAKIACTPRKDYVRFAVYFYNNTEDIDELIDCLKY